MAWRTHLLVGLAIVCAWTYWSMLPSFQDHPAVDMLLLGHVTSTSASIWLRKDTAQPVSLICKENSDVSVKGVEDVDSQTNTTIFRFNNLSPRTRYICALEPSVADLPPVEFSTAADPATHEDTEFIFSSCLTQLAWPFDKMTSLPVISKLKPQFFLLMGDLVYVDFLRDSLQRAYYGTWGKPEFQQLRRTVPMLSQYDDHEVRNDFDLGHTSPEAATPLHWHDRFAGLLNPRNWGQDIRYYNTSLGTMDMFVLDTRGYRDRTNATDGAHKTLLGQQQKETLFTWLRESQSPFKIIASPVPWSTQVWIGDGWRYYRHEREEILDFIEAHNICGVLLISADIHSQLFVRIRPHIYEFSVSPAHSFPIPSPPSFEDIGDSDEVLKSSWGGQAFGVIGTKQRGQSLSLSLYTNSPWPWSAVDRTWNMDFTAKSLCPRSK